MFGHGIRVRLREELGEEPSYFRRVAFDSEYPVVGVEKFLPQVQVLLLLPKSVDKRIIPCWRSALFCLGRISVVRNVIRIAEVEKSDFHQGLPYGIFNI